MTAKGGSGRRSDLKEKESERSVEMPIGAGPLVRALVESGLCAIAHRSVLERRAKPAISSADQRESLYFVIGDRSFLADASDGQDGTGVGAE